ncbi:cytochrome d ubiquinol oxidase subunit II [Mangrovihabitans endophyticus]|uniref:Cytochrome c oxidase assembly protein n=1 Tax=Mangrovihabitans endophyticus TaxID=1751298 RepID=A0A8J3C835_9ACTN|nr:cytochrome d ubiquinol oxidase subunit II [Mangrovihabitans endophyticus]GGL17089.1 cytochrome c oxidase assembly protein [Mangrovihabitans endophyticus]
MITFWYAVVVLAWALFFVLEGFDFGVGLLAPLLGRNEHERGAAISTVGPFWDGNEVWLVAAIGATFAAFPAWYAALLSGLYLPMAAVLLLLALRGVALEFRGKGDGARWRRACDTVLAVSSGGIVLLFGAVLAATVSGLALNADGEVTGTGPLRSLAPLGGSAALAGAAGSLAAAALLGATFLALRTTGPVRRRARRASVTLAWTLAAACVAATGAGLRQAAVGVLLCAGIALFARTGKEATAFAAAAAGVAAAVIAVFTAHGDVLLPSTLSPAWSLTRAASAATPDTLRLLTVAGVVILPGVVAYQAFSYWVFRRRVSSERATTR